MDEKFPRRVTVATKAKSFTEQPYRYMGTADAAASLSVKRPVHQHSELAGRFSVAIEERPLPIVRVVRVCIHLVARRRARRCCHCAGMKEAHGIGRLH